MVHIFYPLGKFIILFEYVDKKRGGGANSYHIKEVKFGTKNQGDVFPLGFLCKLTLPNYLHYTNNPTTVPVPMDANVAASNIFKRYLATIIAFSA